MLVIPAIDLKNGKCVRLMQGRADRETVYGADPLAMAWRFQQSGARMIHVVDLDGAFNGRAANLDAIAA
ncbi:MAG: HisA/HisF-related TIM barrel protein, partial [SAR324 cluster bacterium]|nr:HisA/HisF-related TIM barrel protein [SAR324 cluster bacterium]